MGADVVAQVRPTDLSAPVNLSKLNCLLKNSTDFTDEGSTLTWLITLEMNLTGLKAEESAVFGYGFTNQVIENRVKTPNRVNTIRHFAKHVDDSVSLLKKLHEVYSTGAIQQTWFSKFNNTTMASSRLQNIVK